MDEEKKELDIEETEDSDFETEPDFDEFDADEAPLDEPYHQISLPEEQPELFGDSAEEEEKTVREEILEDEGAGAYAAAQQKAEEDREVNEILDKRNAVNPTPPTTSWKTVHSEFAAEVERFAREAEDFAKKVTEYVNDPELNFAREKDVEDKAEPETEPETPEQPEKKRAELEYTDVEPEEVEIPSQEETIIPEPQPEPREVREEAQELVTEELPVEQEKPKKKHRFFDKSKWRLRLTEEKINDVVIPAEFDIPTGTAEEWAEMEAEEPVVAERQKPKYSFNDDSTRELNPAEELPSDTTRLRANLGVFDIPDVAEEAPEKPVEQKPDGIEGDTGYLPDLSKLGETPVPAAAEIPVPEVTEALEPEEAPEAEVAEDTAALDLDNTGTIEDIEKTLDNFLPPEEREAALNQGAEEEDTEPAEEADDEEPDEKPHNFWDTIKTTVVNALEGGESDGEFTEITPEEEEAEKKALAEETMALPVHNENITHQFHEKTEDADMETEEDQISEAYNSFKTSVLQNVDEYLGEESSEEDDFEKTGELEEEEPVDQKTKAIDPSKEETLDLAEAAAQQEEQQKKKSNFIHTYELEKIPNIVPAEAHFNSLDRTILASGKDQPVVHADPEQIDGQIKLSGFDDAEPTPEQVDDKHVEAALRAKRTQQVKDFKIEREEEPETAEVDVENEPTSSLDEMPRFSHTNVKDFINDEYRGPDDRRRINKSLSSAEHSSLIATIAQAVLTLAGLVLGIIIALAHGNLEAIGGSSVTCGIIALVLLLASAGFGWQIMKKGFLGLFKGKINAASGLAVLYVICLIEDIVLMFAETSSQAASLYTAAACFGMTMSSLSRHLSLKRVLDNFKFLNGGTHLHSTRVITSKEDAKNIGRGLLVDEPTIAYHTASDIPAGFIEDSFADDPADDNSKRPFFIVIAAAAVVGLIAGIVGHSAATGVNVLTSILALGIPAFSILAYNFGLFYEDKYFSRKNAVIVGHRAVEKSAYIDTFALNSADLFGKGSCSILGIKTFHDMKIDDAILYAAALVVRSDGPLAEVFEKTILGKRNLLPEIEDLQYEERLGLSAWSHDRRILFGNREFLINHNVQVPNEEYEAEYTRNGHKVCYLAISGKIAAMFVIRYRASRRVRKCLRQLDRAGIVLLVRNTDCNVTEEMISKKFRISPAAVKVISPVAGDLLKKYQDGADETASEDIGILHTGSTEASLKSLYEARRLYEGVSINSVLSLAYAAIAVILGIVFAFTTATGMLSDPWVLLIQAVGTLIAVGMAWSRSRQGVKDKRK